MMDPIRVLHVDDDPKFAKLTATYLNQEGDNQFDTVSEVGATDALDYLQTSDSAVDCIVSDYALPEMDGLEFLQKVREAHPDLPFIFFTGRGSEEVASDALRLGATDYLQKQSGSEQYELLGNRIQNAVAQQQTEQQAENLQRIRTLVRNINQALVRASSRDEVETEVCELISEADPYLAACFATVDPETMRVEPRTWGGVGEEFIDNFEMGVDDESTGRQAPGGRAFHDREIAFSQNIQEDPRYAKWRESATEQGFQSLAVVPIEHEEELYGLLAIFASRTNASDETEAEVLSELGDDLAHAIHAQELRSELQRTNEEFSTVFEQAPGGLILMDYDDGTFRYQRFNRQMETFSGLSSEEIRGKTPKEVLGPEDGAEVESRYRECVDRGEPVEYVSTFEIDGEEVIRKGIVAPVRKDGGVKQLVTVVEDITEQRKREQRLRATTARLEALFDHSPDMIDVLDETGTIQDVNARFCEELGYSEAELLGMGIWEVDQLVDANDVHELLSDFSIDERRKFEGRYERHDGSTFPVEVHLLRLDLDDEDSFLAISRDITERKQREQNRERIINRVTDAIVEVDADWQFTLVDQRAEELYGMDETELLGKNFWDVFAEARGTRFEEEYRTVMETSEPTSFVEYYTGLDGWFDIHVYPTEDGGISFYFRDVTERIEREREIERYETILGQLPVGVFRSTLDGEFVDVNTAFVSLLDAESKEDVMATNATGFYADPDIRRKLTERLEKEGVVTDEEIQITTLEGEKIWVSATLTLTESGDDRYLEGIAQDITERKERTREFQRQNERLERFTSVVSHDLQNPLNVAEGRIELAQKDCDSEHLGEAASAIDRSQSLIDGLLTVAREGDQMDNIQSLALAEVIDSCWSNVETKDATIVIDTNQRIRADESKLRQLLENLFRNATEHGGDSEITITVGDLDDGFYVADDGIGIPEEDRDDVFESGFSTSSSTGLGLAIVKEIADVHGWEISLTDSQDGGIRFEITDVN